MPFMANEDPERPPAEQPLREDDLELDPVRQFHRWFQDAGQAGVAAPEAAAVATATPDGQPSLRMVLVKRVDETGFVFYTNYDSRKGRELAQNPRAALMFYWPQLGRQVRVEGSVAPTARQESISYIRSRARGSQLSALASAQSRPVQSRTALERRVAELAAEHPDGDLPLPERWGGFRLSPESFEFWQQRADRLHDRFVYQRGIEVGCWSRVRLQP
jgi:pyridoxamine 5'-phosphate oxidase